jgi:glutathione S-transferase
MKLYGTRLSPFVRKVKIALEEKGISHESGDLVPLPKTPELLAMNPLGKIPILRDGDVVVPDSSVICAYLEAKFPACALYPSDPAELARALFLEEYADAHMSTGWGALVYERFIKPTYLGESTDAARTEQLLAEVGARWFDGGPLLPVMDFLESQVPEHGDCVLSRFGIADVALGAHLGWPQAVGVALDARRWPRVARYLGALLARPSFKSAMAL